MIKQPDEACAADGTFVSPETDKVVIESRPHEGNSILRFAGMFKGEFRPMTIEEMNEIIADGWAGQIE